jgi:predicted Zn-dependent peptidase
MAWRAPSASNPDYAAFLLAQEMLAGGSGVSFLQNDWGTPARPESPLAQVTDDLTTWFPPSAQDYVFVVGGSIAESGSEAPIESAIQQGILDLSQALGNPDAATQRSVNASLEQARERVRRDLVFDVLTTEDAAHQLAFFAGLGALDVLLNLPAALDQVSTGDVRRVLDTYLGPDQRNIAWYVPVVTDPPVAQTEPSPPGRMAAAEPDPAGNQPSAMPPARVAHHEIPGSGLEEVTAPPRLVHLANGLPVILQRSGLSPTISLRVVTPLAEFPEGTPVTPHQPAWNLSSLDYELIHNELDWDELGDALAKAREAMAAAKPWSDSTEAEGLSPEEIVDQYFTEILSLEPVPFVSPLAPAAVIVSGDFDPEQATASIERELGSLRFEQVAPLPDPKAPQAIYEAPQAMNEAVLPVEIESTLPSPLAQVHLGYVAPAPGPGETGASAWRMALYILSHGYEGRLGKEAIGNRGLIYYIDSTYQTDSRNGWVTLSMGVDPNQLPAMKQLLRATLIELETHPPTQQEVDEARNHLLGRFLSAAQSNAELVNRLSLNWLWHGSLPTYAEMQKLYGAVQRQDILNLLPAFTRGSVVAVQNPAEPAQQP